MQAETGQATGFNPVGFIELATEPGRLEEYRRISAFNRAMGVDVQEISAHEVESLFPLCRTDDVLAGFYVEVCVRKPNRQLQFLPTKTHDPLIPTLV